MISFLRQYWGWLLMIISFFVIVVLAVATTEEVTIGGTVIEHNVTSDRHGERTYSTIVRSDDGFIEEVTGLNAYIVPVGGRLTYKKVRHKTLKF